MSRSDDINRLPEGLPVPEDDGACRHLGGMTVPEVQLPSTQDGPVTLPGNHDGRTVVYVFPFAGRPDRPIFDGWNDIPGARGCTPQSCAFRDHMDDFRRLNVLVYGLSTQPPADQREIAARLELSFPLLSDESRAFTEALRLPTFTVEGRVMIKRLTLIVRGGAIEHVFYPVFPPDGNAEAVLSWLEAHPQGHPDGNAQGN